MVGIDGGGGGAGAGESDVGKVETTELEHQ